MDERQYKESQGAAKASIPVQTEAVKENDKTTEQKKQFEKKIHELRLANMDLRHEQAKLRTKVNRLEEENRDLKGKAQLSDKKSEADCKMIIDQLKTISGLEQGLKQAKELYSKVKKNLKKAKSLFESTLSVKLMYEKVIAQLVKDPKTSEATYSHIETQQRESLEAQTPNKEDANLQKLLPALFSKKPLSKQRPVSVPARVEAIEGLAVKTSTRSPSLVQQK